MLPSSEIRFVRAVSLIMLITVSAAIASAQSASEGSFPFVAGTHVSVGPTWRLAGLAGASIPGVMRGTRTVLRSSSWGSVLRTTGPTVVGTTTSLPVAAELDQNYPNPFNLETTLRYRIPERSTVRLAVFDLLGRVVAIVQEGQQEAGEHLTIFDAGNLSSGVSFCRLDATSARSGHVYSGTKQMLLVK